MAYAMGLPLLVVRERGVAADGIFDPAVGELFVHQAELTNTWLSSPAFRQPVSEWLCAVRTADREGSAP